jgi:hypothetical protein
MKIITLNFYKNISTKQRYLAQLPDNKYIYYGYKDKK